MQTGRSKELVAGSSAGPGGRATPMPGHRQTQLQRDIQGALETQGWETQNTRTH